MALLVPAARNQRGDRNYSGTPTTTWGTTLTGGTSHNLPASPTELVASTAFEAEWIRIEFHGMFVAATRPDALGNNYTGPRASETLFIDSLQAGWSNTVANAGVGQVYWFPVRIPSGTRISASLRSLIASDTCYIKIDYGVSNGAFWVGSGVETLGEVTASSRGTAVTPGNAAEGSWATIGTTGQRWRYLALGVQGNNDTTANAGLLAWDVGTGSAIYQGMENLTTFMNSNEYVQRNDADRWCDIPSGTSLQVRANAHAAVSGLTYATLHGVY